MRISYWVPTCALPIYARGYLHMALGLQRPAHDAEAHQRLAATHQEARNDGVERALARPNLVGVARCPVENATEVMRSEDGRLGRGGVSTFRYRESPYH